MTLFNKSACGRAVEETNWFEPSFRTFDGNYYDGVK